MTNLTARFLSAFALSAAAFGLNAPTALAGHDDDWDRGRPDKRIEVFVDAGHDRALERAIAAEIARSNRGVNIVSSPRYADVTVTVNGRVSDVYTRREPYDRYRHGIAAVDYDYRVTVRYGNRKVDSERIRGRVVEPLERWGYYPGAYDARPGEIIAGVLIGVLTGHDGREAAGYRLERELTLKAYQRVADAVANMRLPRAYGRNR